MADRNRVLVGQLWHEGHSFNPVVTSRGDFSFARGPGILVDARTEGTAFGGIVRQADALGYVCVPALAARARPGGLVDETFFQELARDFEGIAKAGGFAAICLELHGATSAERTADTEGDLLRRLRAIVGPDMPISVALDLHAYMTPRMVEAATIITGYRTNPHADMVETGARAMSLLDGVIRGGKQPRPVMTLLPFLTRGNDETSSGPLVAICAAADAWRARPGIIDVSIFNIHPFLDVPGAGQAVLAYDDGRGAADEACRTLGGMLWEKRAEFTERLMPLDQAMLLATTSDLPLALGDQGDRVVGAGPGDSVEIVRAASERYPGLAVAAPVFDPAAVDAARRAGIGEEVEIPVGGSITPQFSPLTKRWRIERLARAKFVNKGPYMGGVEADLGDVAVLRHGRLTVIVTSKAPNVHDPAFYEALEVSVASQDVLVAKAANHYKLSFAGLARTITVDTPGLTAFRPQEFPFAQARPLYPLDDVDWTA